MALVEEHLYSRLSGFAGLTALISTRIYYVKMPSPTTLPALSYQKIFTEHVESMTGSSALCFATFQIDCWSRTYPNVKAIAEQVRLCLQGYKNTLSGLTIFGINYLSETDLYDDDAEVFRVMQELRVHHNEDQPS